MTKQQFDTAKKKLTKQIPAFAARIAPVYFVLSWHWSPKNIQFIPKANDIEQTLHKLLESIPDPSFKSVSTGGLTVEVDEDGISMGFYVGVDSGGTDPLG